MGRKKVKPSKTGKCSICDVKCEITHLHHIIERSEGGPNTWANLIELCPNCHYSIHHGTLKVIEKNYSTAGWLIKYIKEGQETFKRIE